MGFCDGPSGIRGFSRSILGIAHLERVRSSIVVVRYLKCELAGRIWQLKHDLK